MNIGNLVTRLFTLLIFVASCTDDAARIHASTTDSVDGAPNHDQHAPANADDTKRVNSGVIKEDTMKGSPHTTAMGNVGTTHVHMTYSSPGVKDRVIWGGLVAYDKVWVAGAHQATKVNFSKDVTVNGTNVSAGDYAFFAIPGKEKWTLILNKNHSQHLADEYDTKDDVVRVEILPAQTDTITKRLEYTVKNVGEAKGEILLRWEKVAVALPFSTK